MDVKQLHYILAIAEEGGVTKAASKLFITQSALDQQLLKLERELGVQLFRRARNDFALTPAGEIYVSYAKRMLALKNEAYLIIQDLADRQRGRLSVAFAPERGMEMFMAVYPDFYLTYPEVTVVPREMSVRRQLELLQKEELDLGFVSMREVSAPGLTCIPLVREEFVLIVPPSYPQAKLAAPRGKPLKILDPELVRDVPFSLMYRESTQREVLDPIFEGWGFAPNLFLETASNRANVSMVERGLSCSIVPYFYVTGSDRVAVFRLKERPFWSISVCYRRGRYLSRSVQDFIDRARQYFLSQMPQPEGKETTT